MCISTDGLINEIEVYSNMKYYFFRDIDHDDNFLDGKTYHASGYVEKLYCDLNNPNQSGKDLAVSYFNPFKGVVESAWRSVHETELFEVDETEYKEIIEKYNKIECL